MARVDQTLREQIIDYYARGYSLRETGRKVGRNLESVRQVLLKFRPDLIRKPYVGVGMEPHQRLAECSR